LRRVWLNRHVNPDRMLTSWKLDRVSRRIRTGVSFVRQVDDVNAGHFVPQTLRQVSFLDLTQQHVAAAQAQNAVGGRLIKRDGGRLDTFTLSIGSRVALNDNFMGGLGDSPQRDLSQGRKAISGAHDRRER